MISLIGESLIDRHFPFAGKCLFCDHPDSRHRIFDAIKERYEAVDRVEDLADDYGIAIEVVQAILELR